MTSFLNVRNVFQYLKFVFERLPTAITPEDLYDLLPDQLAHTHPELKKSQEVDE